MENRDFIIGGKSYSTAESVLLCQTGNAFDTSMRIYRTSKGVFFKVVESPYTKELQVEIIDKDTAFQLMDKNTGGIINENYIKVFGEPERG